MTTLEDKAKKYDEIQKKGLEAQRAKLPAAILALLDRLDPDAQAAWLEANKNTIEGVKFEPGPQTPKPAGPGYPVAAAARKNKADHEVYKMNSL
jgi:hypothetical protein